MSPRKIKKLVRVITKKDLSGEELAKHRARRRIKSEGLIEKDNGF